MTIAGLNPCFVFCARTGLEMKQASFACWPNMWFGSPKELLQPGVICTSWLKAAAIDKFNVDFWAYASFAGMLWWVSSSRLWQLLGTSTERTIISIRRQLNGFSIRYQGPHFLIAKQDSEETGGLRALPSTDSLAIQDAPEDGPTV